MVRRKILLYMPALLGGGAERVFALLASAIARRGHEVLFAVDRAADENTRFLDPAVRLVVMDAGHFGATLALARLIRAERPDVTFSGIGVANLKHMIAAALARRLRRAILTFHAFFVTEAHGRLSAAGNAMTPLLTRLAGHSVAVSDGLLADILNHKGGYAPRMSRIYNPVVQAPPDAVPDAAQLATRAPIVLYLGRFHPDKDLQTLLRAFAMVHHPGARLMIAGDGVERPRYEALAHTLNITDRVDFVGYLQDPAVALKTARVFAFSSRRESFGNVVAEALAFGLPVVTTASDGPSEIVEGGRYGTVVPIGDTEALARGIDAALADPGDPAPRVAHARTFAVERVVDQYLELIEAVIARAP